MYSKRSGIKTPPSHPFTVYPCRHFDTENPHGKDLGGFDGYAEGIWGNPSLAKIQLKFKKKHIKEREYLFPPMFSYSQTLLLVSLIVVNLVVLRSKLVNIKELRDHIKADPSYHYPGPPYTYQERKLER